MIELKNVTKRYGNLTAVDHLNMEIRDGEMITLVGESGCGKSTTLRMINRLVDYDEGEILINGKDIHSFKPEELRRRIGYAIQNTGLFPHMTVGENIAIVPRLLKWKENDILKREEELLKLVGLEPAVYINKYPSELSGGEAQRVGVARALAGRPEIILMDEPFGAVDPINRAVLQQEFLKIQKQLKITAVFVTHDIDEAMKLGDRIAIMSHGKLQCLDTPDRVILSDNSFVQKFLGKESYIRALARHTVSDLVKKENTEDVEDSVHISDQMNLRDAFGVMLEYGTDHLQVENESHQITGVLRTKDIISVFRESENA